MPDYPTHLPDDDLEPGPGQLPAIPPDVYVHDVTTGTAAARAYDVQNPTDAGETLLVIVSCNSINAAVTGLTDTRGNRYALDYSFTTTPTTWAFRAQGQSAGPVAGQPTAALTRADRVTVACSGSVSMTVGVLAVHARTGPLDQRNWVTGAGATWNAPVTPTGPDNFGVALSASQVGGSAVGFDEPFMFLVSALLGQYTSCAYLLRAGPGGVAVPCVARAGSGEAATMYRMAHWSFVPLLENLTETLPDATEGQPYTAPLAAEGGRAPHAWAVAEGVLPAGLTLAGSQITGTPLPDIAAEYPLVLRVTDALGTAVTRSYVLRVAEALGITTDSLPDAAVGEPYDVALEAHGGELPYAWELTGLPAGLALSGPNITGTPEPEAEGDAEVAATVTDNAGSSASAAWTLAVGPEPPPSVVVIVTTELPSGIAGEPYSALLLADHGQPPYDWEAEGLPAGLGIAPSIWPSRDALISGTPAEPGQSDVLARVTDFGGGSDETHLPLLIREPAEPEPEPPRWLVPVIWDGLNVNAGDRPDGTTVVITDVEGWYGSPPLDGHDLSRALTDGSVFGTKTALARPIVLHGGATGPHTALAAFSRALAARAAARRPAELAIADSDHPDLPMLTAMVRADSDALEHSWHGRGYVAWQVTLTAADPRLYEAEWREAVLSFSGSEGTGRTYPWNPPRYYTAAFLPNSARLANAGNVAAPAWATWTGPMDESRLTDGNRSIRVAPLAERQEVIVETSTLVALAPGGATRASYILAGSQPLTAPPGTSVTWHLYGTGAGRVTLRWRGAWA